VKIAILGHYPTETMICGGVARVVYNLSHELSKGSDDVVLFQKKKYRDLFKPQKCSEDNGLMICKVSHLGLIISLVKGKYDIINIHNLSSFFVLPLILKKSKAISSKIVFVSHGLVPLEKREQMYDYPLRYFIYQRMGLHWSDYVVAVSNHSKSKILAMYNIDENKISVIHNGIGKMFFTEKNLRPVVDFPKYALFVGSITNIKGLSFLLTAAQKIDDCCVILVGWETPYLNELKKNFNELFELKKVIYMKEVNTKTLLSLYSNAEFLVLPSRYDSYAMVVLEAMAAGKPVIISDNVGSKEIIENGKEGFIIPFGDVESLTSAMSNLLNDEHLAKKMGCFARKKSLQNTWETKAKEYISMFKEIIV
jgi:glycosyltransferase involved in cell wall biosynthesis